MEIALKDYYKKASKPKFFKISILHTLSLTGCGDVLKFPMSHFQEFALFQLPVMVPV